MLITNLISRYMKLCKAAFSAGDGLKLNKSIQINVMEMLFLLMVILIFFYALFCIDNLLHCNTSPFMKQKITFYRVKGNLFVIACVLNSYNFAIKSITVHPL